MFLLLAVIALIVHGSLYPWHFDSAGAAANPLLVLLHSWPERFDSYTALDVEINLAFYFPLGVAAFLHFAQCRSRMAAALMALCFGTVLSAALEMLQVYVPGRVCSLLDVTVNLGGTALGVVVAVLFQRSLERFFRILSRPLYKPSGPPAFLLLACWLGYQFFPFAPQFRPSSIQYEVWFLGHPDSLYPAEIFTNISEWFVIALIVHSLSNRLKLRWIFVGVMVRIALRPFFLTRGFALDEVIGVAAALLLWMVVPVRLRSPLGLFMLIGAVLLRQLTALPFATLPAYLGPGGIVLRRAFDYGSVVWLLGVLGMSRRRAGILVVASLVLMAAMQKYLPGRRLSVSGPAIGAAIALALWLTDLHTNRSPRAQQE